jgi:hypothetical protein
LTLPKNVQFYTDHVISSKFRAAILNLG